MSSEFSLSLRSMSCSSFRPTASQMTSSEDGCPSNIYADADSTDGCPSSLYVDQESIHSSDIECNSESVHIDRISDQVSQPNSDELCASSPSSGTAEQVRTPPKIEVAHQAPAKKHRLRMMDEDADGVRVKILPCPKEQLRRRLRVTQVLGDDFDVPNRAQLMLKFLQQHGDRSTKEKPGPKKCFSSTLKLVQYVMKQSKTSSAR